MNDDKKDGIKIKELNLDELAKVEGGFKYKGAEGHRLNGADIICPCCGYGYKQTIRTSNELDARSVLFACYICGTSFVCTYTEDGVETKILNSKQK